MMKVNEYTTYSAESDMTFIMRETYVNDEVGSVEVIGFHYGEPTATSIRDYADRRKALFLVAN